MRGKDAETLEDLLINQIEDINLLKIEDKTNKEKHKEHKTATCGHLFRSWGWSAIMPLTGWAGI